MRDVTVHWDQHRSLRGRLEGTKVSHNVLTGAAHSPPGALGFELRRIK